MAKDTYQAEAILRDQIDNAKIVEELIKLKDKFELAINKGARTLSERNSDIYSKRETAYFTNGNMAPF